MVMNTNVDVIFHKRSFLHATLPSTFVKVDKTYVNVNEELSGFLKLIASSLRRGEHHASQDSPIPLVGYCSVEGCSIAVT